MRHIFRATIMLAAAVAITSCAGIGIDNSLIGRGPITLSPKTQKIFNEYLAKPEPQYFAVTEDGRVGYYTYCKGIRCQRSSSKRVVETCAHQAGRACKLYASSTQIVWDETKRAE